MPIGLNIGAQLFWQFAEDPTLPDRTALVVTWPQYWAFRLTGRTACDLTFLGCHTDLWNPHLGQPSSLVARLGLAGKLAPILSPADLLGPVLPEVAAATGLRPDTPVVCGIRDSNASLFRHLVDRPAPFSVVSTGTWVICMAMGGTTVTLDPARDTLVNVNALGAPAPSARFMGGREFDTVMQGRKGTATEGDILHVLRQDLMLFPAIQRGSGPYPDRSSSWTHSMRTTGQTEIALGYHLALMTAECLTMIGVQGPVIVEGPFSHNRHFTAMLATATSRPVIVSPKLTGKAVGAALLFLPPTSARPLLSETAMDPDQAPANYAEHRKRLVKG